MVTNIRYRVQISVEKIYHFPSNGSHSMETFNTVGTGKPDPKTICRAIWSLYGLWVRFPCPNCVESHIWSLGLVSLSHHCVESHIWSLGPVSLSHHCVEFHIWSLGPVSLSQMC